MNARQTRDLDAAIDSSSLSRRNFLKVSAATAFGGGILLAFNLSVRAAIDDATSGGRSFTPNAFLRIDQAGKVTFTMPYIEMGQGTYTSISMLIAEELEVELGSVVIEHAPPDDKVYANPLIGIQMTGGSTSIRASWEPMRRAGATARSMLISAAANQWNVDANGCQAANGTVIHTESGRKLSYGKLVVAAAKLQLPDTVILKDPAEFKLVGTPHRRLDTPAKINGTAKFGIDVRMPGMKYAVVAISPVFGGRLASLDEAKAMGIAGVNQVVRMSDAVAIVAIHTWAAKQGLEAANPQWDAGPNGTLSTADIVAALRLASDKPGAVARENGNAAAAIASAPLKLDAIYEQPFLAHAAMEPMNCTVRVTEDACDVWVGTQIPGTAQAVVAKATGLRADQVRIHNHLIGGAFGRRLEFDGILRATQIAMQVKGPVKVIWSREEDVQHDMYRPYYFDRISAGLNANGRPIGWQHRLAGSSIMARFNPSTIKNGIDADAVEGSAHPPYDFENIHVDWVAKEPPGISTAFWRGVGSSRGTFVVESFIDELAALSNRDPLAYRLNLLEKNPRAKAVLELVAKHSDWGKPLEAGLGRGIALCTGFGSYIAQVVSIKVEKDGSITVIRVDCAVDCGLTVNPDTVRAQIEGGIIFGLSAVLFGEITLKGGRVEQSNFGDYRVLRINETPQIKVHLLKSMEAPGGIGEPGTSCVMPALTNAVFAATGKRVRKLPVAEQAART